VMPVRLSYLERIPDKSISEKKSTLTTRSKKSHANSKWVIHINLKQVGHIFDTRDEALIYIERHGLSRKLPTITRMTEPLIVTCPICRKGADIVEYRFDKIIYLCSNNHKSEVNLRT